VRIIHVVTLLSPDGRFGGPSRVALDLARMQQELGHSVLVLSGSLGYEDSPSTIEDVPVALFRARALTTRLGFAGLIAPGMTKRLLREARTADIVHIHLARDLITAFAARLLQVAGHSYVIQTHGMIDASARRLTPLVDALFIRPVVRSAKSVMVLTGAEKSEISRIAPVSADRTVQMPNGARLASSPNDTNGPRHDVLFLARLHPRKGGAQFARMASALAPLHPQQRFTIAGPDEGDLSAIKAELESSRVHNVDLLGPVESSSVPTLMARAKLFVLPAASEPFGMTLLEAMTAATPIVVHETAGLAETVLQHNAGLVFDGTTAHLVDVVSELLNDPRRLEVMGRNARELVEELFSLPEITQRVLAEYDR